MRPVRGPVAALAVGIALLWAASPAGAKERVDYVYQIAKVSSAKGIKAPMGNVSKGLRGGVERSKRIAAELPEKAPDPRKQPERFKKYLKKKGLKAYRVNLEVTDYEERVEAIDERGGKRIAVRISLRIFGETIPDRVMAFAGHGAATVKLEVGRTVRDRDREVANHDAIEVAVDQAVAESLRKLDMPPPSKRKRRRKK
jgi:hypothetical protein